ncbi:hypothetical protein CPB85DRAFT_1247189 [Mucidula mucida]|nr:hypothetical protein CPB85DRAFT_1247189 [Mucidula mucida]
MSSALSSRHEQSSRNWWSSSKSAKYPDQPQDMPPPYIPEKSARSSTKSSNGKFNTLASAMGFKSKKHPSLAIQDPPPMPTRTVVSTVVSEDRRGYTNRPASKSVSSTRSQAESSGPRTPVDSQRDLRHQSLLTLSDADPFAASGISVPHSPLDPGRLSVYSNSSMLEYSKRTDTAVNRGSYASTSSYSQGHSDFASISRAASTSEVPTRKRLSGKKSGADLRRNGSAVSIDDRRDAAWESLAHSNGKPGHSTSHAPFADKNRLSQPDTSQVARPFLRARGLTESGGIQMPNLFNEVKATDKTSPRVIVRQASIQRMGLPPSAPPTHQLPTPPSVNIPIVDDSALPDLSRGSSYSSSVLSRDEYMPNQHYILREERSSFRDIPPSHSERDFDADIINLSSSRPTRTLKKSLSHQSLSKRGSPSGSSLPLSVAEAPEKAPRKQRSFHHPRIPMPPIPLPLRHTNSIGTPVPPCGNGDSYEKPDKRGSSSSGTQHRKRLFSGSSFGRPTTASSTQHSEEDNRSVFSLPPESERGGSGSLSKAFSPSSSFWDESGPVPSSPPPMTQEYVPQHIMSPAEMLKVEASVESALSSRNSRQRGLSVVSSSTNASDFSVGEGLAAPFTSSSSLSPASPYRSLSNSQTTLTSITSNSIFSSPPTSSSLHSLPAPPRRRQPPTPNAETGIIPLSPPPRTKVRKKPSTESGMRRSSMMRKPSFLEIDDDADRKRRPSNSPKAEAPPEGSFLDFARESFESERSDDQ